jgi:hypothetical protein
LRLPDSIGAFHISLYIVCVARLTSWQDPYLHDAYAITVFSAILVKNQMTITGGAWRTAAFGVGYSLNYISVPAWVLLGKVANNSTTCQ